jgi:hypothetical protein
MAAGSARAQEPTEEPAGCLQATAHTNGPCKLIYPGGTVIETLADGNTWIELSGVRVQVPKGWPFTSTFETYVIANLPPSDVVGAPQSEGIDIQGDCQSRIYGIVTGAFFQGPNGTGGISDVLQSDLKYRHVEPKSPMDFAFTSLCKAKE